ncbi:beta-lactamase domain-containing protein 2-like [Antedon mediterranea]|uniref:beta-lactamase domain-containing protein 2-like n=1 Tax=Antedon mediterranea TaxID=105859 RepID=UPI003AF7ED12
MDIRTSAIFIVLLAFLFYYGPKFSKELPVVVDGYTAPGFESLLEVMRDNFVSGPEPKDSGSAFAAYYKGVKVAHLWGGYADSESRSVWKEDTMTAAYSCTKGIAAISVAYLVDKGLLDYNVKVAKYWPEFGKSGKENITVEILLSHQAGIPFTPDVMTYNLFRDHDALGEALAATTPLWQPGTHGYHALTMGSYCSQLIKRVDPKNRTLGRFFAEEIAIPFDIDFHIGLPLKENYRVARLSFLSNNNALRVLKGITKEKNRRIAYAYMQPGSLVNKLLVNAGEVGELWHYNDPYVRSIEIPSALGIGTAESLAKIYGILANGGSFNGKTLLSPGLIEKLNSVVVPGVDAIFNYPSLIGLGTMITQLNETNTFGHPGNGGQMSAADPKMRLGYAFLSRHSSSYGSGNDPRYLVLRDELYNCVRKLNKN